MKPQTICAAPGCPEFTVNGNGKCAEHRRIDRRRADKKNGRIRGSRWAEIRKIVLRAQLVCACSGCSRCTPKGCIRPPTEVDHITPLAAGGHPTALTNLQGLCHPCHDDKTRREYKELRPLRDE